MTKDINTLQQDQRYLKIIEEIKTHERCYRITCKPISTDVGDKRHLSEIIQSLLAENERLEKLVYISGLFQCKKCNFRVVSKNLSMANSGVSGKSAEQCPNCNVPMWKVSYADDYKSCVDDALAVLEQSEWLTAEKFGLVKEIS